MKIIEDSNFDLNLFISIIWKKKKKTTEEGAITLSFIAFSLQIGNMIATMSIFLNIVNKDEIFEKANIFIFLTEKNFSN